MQADQKKRKGLSIVNESQRIEPGFVEQSEEMILHHPLVTLVVEPENGRILYANSAAAQFYGWSAEKLQTMNMTQLHLSPDESLREEMLLAQKHLRHSCVFRHRLADGSIHGVEVSIASILWKRQAAMYFFIIDISDRKEAEEALRKSEEQYRQFAQHLSVPLLYGSRSSGRNEFVNAQFVKTFGYTLEDVPTISRWWELAYPDEKYRSERMNLWENTTAADKKSPIHIEPREVKIACKNGEIRLFIASGTVMDDGVLGTFIDITEQRHDERLLMASYERKRKNDLLNDLILHETPSRQVLSACERVMGKRAQSPFNCYLLVMGIYRGKPRKYWLDRRDVYQPLLDSLIDALEDERTIAWEGSEGLGILRFGDEPANRGKVQQIEQAEEITQALMRIEPEFEGAYRCCRAREESVGARHVLSAGGCFCAKRQKNLARA